VPYRVLLSLLLYTCIQADDLDFEGFENEDVIVIEEHIKPESWYTFSGYLSFLSAYNYNQSSQNAAAPGDKVMDFSGLSRAKTKLNLSLDMKHSDIWQSRLEVMSWYDASWAIKGRDNYTNDVLDSYEYFADIKDAYVLGTLCKSIDIKLGRQIVIWGKSDSIRITDVINPLDIREPGMVDIKDLRLSETMSKLNYYFDDYALSIILIHESRLAIEPAFGSDYRPRNVFGPTSPDSFFPDVYQPSWNINNTQFALSLDARFEGWDISVYAAKVLNSRFSIKNNGSNNTNLRNYEMIYMTGLSTSIVNGSWLYKAEAAYITDIDYRSVQDNKNRLDALIGLDYAGFSKTTLSFELANKHVFDYEDIMLEDTLSQTPPIFPDFEREDTLQIALRGNYLFDHDNASVNYLLSMFGSKDFKFEDGGFQRFWLEYKYNDDVSLNAGVVDYIGGNAEVPFYNAIKNNDRVFAEILYHF